MEMGQRSFTKWVDGLKYQVVLLTGNYRYLCSVKSGSEVLGLAIHIDNSGANSGKPYFYDVTNSSLQSDGPRVDDNQWHHILGVLDGLTVRKFILMEIMLVANATVILV